MTAGIIVHEENTWLTIRYRGFLLLHESLAELRNVREVRDVEGNVLLEIELETKKVPPLDRLRQQRLVHESLRAFEDR